MYNLYLVFYVTSFVGILVTLGYCVCDILQCRRLGHLYSIRRTAITRPPTEQSREQPTRKYVSRYRTKMFQRRLINEINRITPKLRIKAPRERYELYYDVEGEIRVRCISPS
ncbi:uncharacterized protein LOC129770679 isoform X2 [Toxorhynchites rutilus septentrionalis]|uniref:uncharacterized protein LOC129770679 isoform X2 n=1 Tax=Toxorhynchites rutilus septentrionalis TaxID=329112 RepID=UPI0024788CD2|nr:uncharacterized protein LOC129770679 isoform X2 [Toxorhynchites rutilus septentrionalis]